MLKVVSQGHFEGFENFGLYLLMDPDPTSVENLATSISIATPKNGRFDLILMTLQVQLVHPRVQTWPFPWRTLRGQPALEVLWPSILEKSCGLPFFP